MDDNTVYILSDELNSIIEKDIEIMDQWLASLSDDELDVFHLICNKDADDRPGGDDYEITRHSLVLYCRELGLEELAITSKLISDITGMFCVNIIVESLRRRGLVKVDGPLMLYKKTKFHLTTKGKELGEEINKKDDE